MLCMSRAGILAAVTALGVLLVVRETSAQPRDSRLVITVVDQTGGVLPGATVTIAGQDEATKSVLIEPATASPEGMATFGGLRPGRYAVKAEFTGFDPRVNPDVRVRAGDNKETISLAIEKLADTVNVARDRQEVAVDRATTFGSALTREQIDALSDDPAVLRQQLAEMAGGPAIIRVDSFEGAPLPPKAQIKSIHITRDGFAAENHNAGAFFIDIVTQPGIGPLRGQVQYGMRPGTLTGNSPFTPIKGPENMQAGVVVIGGTLAREKSSFSLVLQGNTSYTTPNLNVVRPTGSVSQALNLRTPRNNLNVQGLIDYAVTKDQTIRVSFYQLHNSADNLGVGAYDELERAYNTTDTTTNVRIQHTGPFQRRMFTNTRLSVTRTHSDQASAIEAPTIQVLDAFTSGGAQMSGGREATSFTFASDLDYVRGRHSFRAGVLVDGGSWNSNLNSNYLGTYTFNSLAAYAAGLPINFTRRLGDPAIAYSMVDAGLYVQDDFRVRRNLTISPGLRYETQAHMSDWKDLGPRIGMTWAPFKSGRTALRGSAGIFYDWLGQNTYEQALRVDGTHEQELNIVNPSFPNPGTGGVVPPANRYFLDPNLRSPRNVRFSGGIDQTFYNSPTWSMRANALYAYTRTEDAWRGLNQNAPVAGLRPDPGFGQLVHRHAFHAGELARDAAIEIRPRGLADGELQLGARLALAKIIRARPPALDLLEDLARELAATAAVDDVGKDGRIVADDFLRLRHVEEGHDHVPRALHLVYAERFLVLGHGNAVAFDRQIDPEVGESELIEVPPAAGHGDVVLVVEMSGRRVEERTTTDLVRQILAIQMVNATGARVGGNQPLS